MKRDQEGKDGAAERARGRMTDTKVVTVREREERTKGREEGESVGERMEGETVNKAKLILPPSLLSSLATDHLPRFSPFLSSLPPSLCLYICLHIYMHIYMHI